MNVATFGIMPARNSVMVFAFPKALPYAAGMRRRKNREKLAAEYENFGIVESNTAREIEGKVEKKNEFRVDGFDCESRALVLLLSLLWVNWRAVRRLMR